MGVHGLWELLAPVGRRVSVETLAGKKLAIDASIWMVQFMKAMRDEKGDMVRNAHLLGFFRRICKLLFLRTKPVFVFDGATPALKRRTVMARRRQRENAQAKVRKTAEKLLLNQLKAMKLKELAKDIEKQKQDQKQKNDAKGEETLSDQTNKVESRSERNDMVSRTYDQEKLDEMLAASIMAEEDGTFASNASTSAPAIFPVEEDGNEEEEILLPAEHGEVDPAVLAALPPSMQRDLLIQLKGKKMKELATDVENQRQKQENDSKGKKLLSDEIDMLGCTSNSDDLVLRSYNQEKLDEMLAASIVAEEERRFTNDASASVAPLEEEDGEEDEDEEMMLPAMHGEVDPVVLASLPPSMQLDLLVQIRERLIAENRQKYQKVKKDPAKFSELQIQAYLKTVAFRREIDEVQKAASGRGVGGVQTSRIASEANREFIFSSSYTGDKQALTSARVERNNNMQQQTPREHPSQVSINSVASTSKSNTVTSLGPDESRRLFDDNIETYLDDRGRVRVSRVRAMGMHMTRDIQRNLDLMKEIEQERTNNQSVETSHNGNSESVNLNERNEQSILKNDTSIEISFEDHGENECYDGDDNLFARLVSGNPVTISSAEDSSRKQPSNSDSDYDWEEGIIEGKDNSFSNDVRAEIKPSLEEGNISDESEVEWEEGVCDFPKNTSLCPAESGRTVSKGYLQEEADLQEAIKRSLENTGDEKSNFALPQDENKPGENAHGGIGFYNKKLLPVENCTQQHESFCEIVDGVEKMDGVGGINISQTVDSSGRQLKSSVAYNSDNSRMLINKPRESFLGSHPEQSMQDSSEKMQDASESERGSLYREMPCAESVTPLETKEVHVIAEQLLDTFNEGGGLSTSRNSCSKGNSHISDALSGASINDIPIDDKTNDAEAEPVHHLDDMTNPSVPLLKLPTREITNEIDFQQNLAAEKNHDNHTKEREHDKDKSPYESIENVQVEFTEADLEEEMLILDQECLNLGNEQRKLERNAESVSSEMFAECQELLQMFGLPYIIAPMEAEAQCAYMELANLVDGVVTDDSDVFLFGARSVFKNIFDDRKYVETYLMKDIENELGLTKEKLIRMALLLGSDYTEGVSGIGIVNAIEVVNAYPEEDGLHKFREWIESPDPTILRRFDAQTGSSARKRGTKVGDDDLNCSKSNMEGVSAFDQNNFQAQGHKQSATDMQDIKQIFMHKHRNVSKNWHIPSSFPSEAVISAYTSPQVDKSTEPFTWGKPDHFVLRKLCWDKLGWGSQKADELLVPVLKEYEKHETQLRLEAFYTFNERFAKIRSNRIKKAVKGITGNQTSKLMDDTVQEVSQSRKKSRVSPVEPGDNDLEKPSRRPEKIGAQNQTNYMGKSTSKQSRKRRKDGEPVPSKEKNLEPPMEAEGRKSNNKKLRGNGRGRGRGRGRGKRSSGFETCESSDGDNGDDGQEVLVEKLEGSQEVRRSRRFQKRVNYTVNDLEADDVDKSSDQSEKKCSDEEAIEQDLSLAQGISGDAAVGHNEKKQHNAGDPALEGLCRNYLEMGGGICTDEGEIGPPGVSQCGEPSFEVKFSNDYLEMGGGFCQEEGETGNDLDGAHGPATATASENPDLSHCSGFMDEADLDQGSVLSNLNPKGTLNELQHRGRTDAYDTESNLGQLNASNSNDHSNVGVSLEENTKDDTGLTFVGALSAMPFLKRKRRKS